MIREVGWAVVAASLGAMIVAAAAGSAAAQGACAEAASVCRGQIEAGCLTRERVGAAAISTDDVAAGAGCAGQFDLYRACLSEAAAQCGPGDSRGSGGGCSDAVAQQMFSVIADSDDPAEIAAFLEACPNAVQAPLARVRLQRLEEEAVAPSSPRQTSGASAGTVAGSITISEVVAVQRMLARLGMYQGAIDGQWGPASRLALEQLQRKMGFSPADGRLTRELVADLRERSPGDFEELGAAN